MLDRVTRRLIALEARRARPVVTHTLLLGGVALVVLGSVGWLTLARTGWILFVCTLAAPWSLATSVMRDRLEGGLEFLRALPVSPARLAGARLLAAVLFAIPAGVLAAVGRWVVRPLSAGFLPVAGDALAAFWGTTLAVAVAAALATGAGLRFGVRAFGNGIGALLVLVVAAHQLANHVAPGLEGALLSRLWRPAALHLLAGLLPMLAIAVGWVAYHLARTGIERFEPGRDRVTW